MALVLVLDLARDSLENFSRHQTIETSVSPKNHFPRPQQARKIQSSRIQDAVPFNNEANSSVSIHSQCLAELDSNGIELRDKIEEMEQIMVDNLGTNSDGFFNTVTPCSNYVGFQSNATIRGEQSSAQWVRFAFHDFVTANLTEGTG